MTDRILTLHPEGKQGVNIELEKYNKVKEAIVKTLQSGEVMSFKNLGQEVKKQLDGRFNGSVGWYYTTIKLDLEARNIIERIPGSKLQMLRLKRNSKTLM